VRPDVFGIYSRDEFFPIEVKVVRKNDINRVKTGFNQILTYIRTIDVTEGFYVLFCIGDHTLEIPNSILIDARCIHIITIDIFETSPSKRNSIIWTVTQEKLLAPS
jgi:hypothetical protein